MMPIWILLFTVSAPLLVLESYCLDGNSTADRRSEQERVSSAVKTPREEDERDSTTPVHSAANEEDENIKQADGRRNDIDDTENVTDAENVTVVENDTDAENVTDAENDTNAQNVTDAQNAIDAENDTDAEIVTDAENDTNGENVTDAENDIDAENVTGAENDTDGENVTDAENVTAIRSELPGLLAEFCPGANICQEDKSWKLSENVNTSSCCRACSCSENCKLFDNCCFPSPDIGTLENKHKRCFSTLHPAGDVGEQYGYKSYMMVDSEISHSSLTTNSTCGNTNVAPWGSLHPVYSKSHQKIYKNSVCAAAYGVDDGVIWTAYIACNRLDVLLSMMFISTTLLNQRCDVWFKFPGDISMLKEHLCFFNLVGTCPERFSVTTLGSHEKLIAACNSGLFSPYRGKDRAIYRNVFCSVCNSMYHSIGCMSEESTVRNKRPFLALLDNSVSKAFDEPSLYTRVDKACLLKEGTVVESTCRPVRCPSDQTYTTKGRCKFIYNTWYKPKIVVGLQLMSDVAINTTGLTKLSLVSPWRQPWDISHIYYFTSSQDTQTESTDKIMVNMKLRVESIDPKVLTRKINKLKNKKWTVKTSNASLSLGSDFLDAHDDYHLHRPFPMHANNFAKLEINVTRRLKTIYYRNAVNELGYLTIGRMSFCDQVDLTTEDFRIRNHVLYNNMSGEYLLPDEYYFPDLKDDTLVRVCIEDSGLKRVRNGCQGPVITTYMYVSFLCVVFLLVFW